MTEGAEGREGRQCTVERVKHPVGSWVRRNGVVTYARMSMQDSPDSRCCRCEERCRREVQGSLVEEIHRGVVGVNKLLEASDDSR